MYEFMADAIVAVHVAYVGYVVLGQLAIWIGWAFGRQWVRNFWFRLSHVVMMGIVVFEEFLNIRCPLSEWEEHYRELAGQTVKGETFIGRLMHNLIFIDAEPWVFTAIHLGFGLAVFATLILCPPRWPRRRVALPAVTSPSSS